MKREGGRDHLPLAVCHNENGALVHAGGGHPHKGLHLIRGGLQKQPGEGQGVHADVQHGASGQTAAEEAVAHVVVLKAAKVQLDEVYPAQRPGGKALPQQAVNGHVVDGHGLAQDHMVFPGQPGRPPQLLAVERNGLLTQHMLAVGQRRFQKGHVGVVGCGDIDGVDFRVGEHLAVILIDLAHTVLFPKGSRLFRGAVSHGVQPAAHPLKGGGHFIGDDPGAQHRPAQLSVVAHIHTSFLFFTCLLPDDSQAFFFFSRPSISIPTTAPIASAAA